MGLSHVSTKTTLARVTMMTVLGLTASGTTPTLAHALYVIAFKFSTRQTLTGKVTTALMQSFGPDA